jgi:hypothetical protein
MLVDKKIKINVSLNQCTKIDRMIRICEENEKFMHLSNILTALRRIISLDSNEDKNLNIDYAFKTTDLELIKFVRKLGKM